MARYKNCLEKKEFILNIASISWNLNSFVAFLTSGLYCPIPIIALIYVSILTLWTYGERYVSGDQMELTDFRERFGSVSVQGIQLQKLLIQLALVSFDQVRWLFPFRSKLVDIFYFNMDGVPSRQENGNKWYKIRMENQFEQMRNGASYHISTTWERPRS